MSDEKALLSAMWEHPHEDTPRLVYADWLEENGQPERAEFIRVQIELATLRKWDDSPRKLELTQRETQLLTSHSEAWKRGLLPAAEFKKPTFHRGFPNPKRRRISPGKFLKLKAADFASAPLWNFNIDTNRHSFEDLRSSPSLLRVGTLEFDGWLDSPDAVRQFVASPNIRNLSAIEVKHSSFDGERLTVLGAGAGALPYLRELDLTHNAITADAVREFALSPLADGIENLSLSFNPLGPDGVLALADSPQLARLRKLSIAGCGRIGGGSDLNGNAMKALFDSPHLENLRALHVGHSGLELPDILKMCESRPRFRLSDLSMTDSSIGDAGAEAIASWPAMEHIRVLIVPSCGIGAAGGRAFVRSPYLNHVTSFWLQANPVLNDPSVMSNLKRRFGSALELK